jgi:hypothetical protein
MFPITISMIGILSGLSDPAPTMHHPKNGALRWEELGASVKNNKATR